MDHTGQVAIELTLAIKGAATSPPSTSGGSIGTPLRPGLARRPAAGRPPGYAEQTAAQAAAALDTRRENVVSWLSERQGDGNSPG